MFFRELIFLCCVVGIVQSLPPSAETLRQYLKFEHISREQIEKYIKDTEDKLEFTNRELDELSTVIPPKDDKQEYLSHPLNMYSLARRVQKRWMRSVALFEDYQVSEKERINFANNMEYFASVTAYTIQNIAKLQVIYNLDIYDLVNGNIDGLKVYANISADDCMTIAKHYYYKNLHYKEASFWLEMAFHKHMAEKDQSVDPTRVLEYLYLAKCFDGNNEIPKLIYKDMVDMDPTFEPSESLLDDHHLASRGCKEAAASKEAAVNKATLRFPIKELENTSDLVCRGFVTPQDDLKCRYIHYNKPHLMIGPLKLEELHIDPPVVLFHDVISDDEIEAIKKTSRLLRNWWKQDTVVDITYSIVRQTEATRLHEETEIERKLSRRVSTVTDMDLSVSEEPTVSSYGPGGEYIAHYDFYPEDIRSSDNILTNRLATFMFYLDDVRMGGHTGFPAFKISVAPRKGSALFWFNLFKNGTRNINTIHNACPVVLGYKTVMTQWILGAGNEFRQPCGLLPESSFKYFYL